MATVITAADVVAAYGEYYINNGQNESDIHTKLMETLETQESFTVVESDDTILRAVNASFSEVIQSFQKVFTPKGGVTFTPKDILLYNVKVDQAFYPDDLKNSWLAFMTSNKLDRTQWPFVKWFIEEYVLKQILEDLETKVMYKAIYAAPSSGVANAAIDTINGIKKKINDAITAGTMLPLATGAPSTTNATWANQVEAFVDLIPELYRTKNMPLNMNRTLDTRYKRGRAEKYNIQYAQVDDLKVVQYYENIRSVGRPSMNGSSKIWATPKENAIMAFKGGSNKSLVQVENVDRMVKVYTDFWLGVGFIDDSLVFSNDRDLVNGTLA